MAGDMIWICHPLSVNCTPGTRRDAYIIEIGLYEVPGYIMLHIIYT